MAQREVLTGVARARLSATAAFVACLLVAPAGAQTPERGAALSIGEAQMLAVERSRLVAASRAQTQASREMRVSADQLPDPVLQAGLENVPVNGSDQFSIGRDFMTQRSIGVTQEFVREDKRKARAARFEREAEVGEARRELTVAQIRRDVSIAWLERSFQESTRTLLESDAKEVELQVEAADSAYRAGRGSQADAFAARTLLEQIRDRIGQADQQIAAATALLSRWVGADAQRPLAERPAADAAPPRDDLLDDRVDRHPQLAMLAGQEAMAQADADLARANRRPDWSWGLTYSQRGSSYSNMVSINVSVPLPWNRAHLQDRELAARLAQREQAQAEREDARRALVADAQATWRQWEIERSRLARYDGSLIPLAQQRIAAALAAYRGAGATLATVLEARRSEIEMRLDRLNIELDSARLWAQLDYLVPMQADGFQR
jgi:outer membrane protein TolC